MWLRFSEKVADGSEGKFAVTESKYRPVYQISLFAHLSPGQILVGAATPNPPFAAPAAKKNCSNTCHLRQSFVPGEITPEEANRLGCELARRFTKGKHAFIVCTHIDRKHIHNVRPDRAMRKAVEGTAP